MPWRTGLYHIMPAECRRHAYEVEAVFSRSIATDAPIIIKASIHSEYGRRRPAWASLLHEHTDYYLLAITSPVDEDRHFFIASSASFL